MAEVLLFHHALGMTPASRPSRTSFGGRAHRAYARSLRGPDFATLDEGVALRGEVGFGEVIERRRARRERVAPGAGATPASRSACCLRRSSPRHAQVPGAHCFFDPVPARLGVRTSWPTDVPAQIHGMDADPFFVDEGDLAAARALVESTDQAELFLYPGDQHYFADSTLPSYDAGATALLTQRVLDFLATR